MIPTAKTLAEPSPLRDPTELSRNETAETIGFKNGSFVFAPIPFENPSLGTGLALGGAYLFKSDEASNSSTIGGGAFRTNNGSEGYGLGWSLNFREGLWTTKLLYADADLNYNLFSLGTAIPVAQTARGVSLELHRKISQNVRIGGIFGYGESSIRLRNGGVLPPIFDRDRKFDMARVSLKFEKDTRDDNFFPRDGQLLSGVLSYGHFLGGIDRSYMKGVLGGSAYRSVLGDGVIAAKGVLCAADDDAPFFDSCSLGADDAFRGYVATKYIGKRLASAQIEYRGHLTGRLGFVVFAGAGTVGDDFGDLIGNDVKLAAGAGARIRLSKTFPVDYAIDVALNESGEGLLYISVGQRF